MGAALRGLIACAAAASLPACGVAAVIPVELPQVAGTQSYVLLAPQRIDVGAPGAPIRIEGEEGAAVELAIYDAPPEALGLSLGVAPLTPPSCAACELLRPLSVFTRDALVGDAWSPQAALSAGAAARLVPDAWPRCSCARLEQTVVAIPSAQRSEVVAVLEEPSGAAVLVIDDGTLIRLHLDLRTERICGPWAPVAHATLTEAGRVWVAAEDRVARVLLDAQRADAPCVADTSTMTRALQEERPMAIGGEEGWIVLISREGTIFTWTDRFTRLAQIDTPSRPVFLPNGRRAVILSHEESDQLHRISDDQIRSTVGVRTDSIDAITRTEAHGLVAALELAGIAVEDGPRFRPVSVEGWAGATALVPFGRGVFAVGRGGVQLTERFELCPQLPRFTEEMVFRVGRLGDGSVVFGDIISNDPMKPSGVGVVSSVPWCERGN